uniref:Uncharacterized protein n=1 Tax=Rhizophora mucronata TaxID=61149 RepID=A0A2P2QCS2_RHIMU
MPRVSWLLVESRTSILQSICLLRLVTGV